jgi:membrane fusion protein, multidrug efflux system
MAAFILVTACLTVFLTHHRRAATSKSANERRQIEAAGQTVETAVVKESPTERTLLLIGETRAYYSVTLYARVSGYMNGLFADIGDIVKKNQLLAHVESPEQEQAYNAASADAFNKRRIAQRLQVLRKRKLVSQQQLEQSVSDADTSEANLRTQGVIRAYQDIIAPFDGIISNRYVDPGWLLQNASGSQAASQPLFQVTENDKLRVFIYVDQKDAPFVRAGDPVEILVPNQAEVRYQAKIAMVAGELDPRTRTLLTEVVMDNPQQKIVAGSFVQVQMKVHTPPFLELPIQALVMREKQPYVSVVESGKSGEKLRYAKIDLAENDGENILIRSGVKLGERVALNLGNSALNGQKIQGVAPQAQAQAPSAPPPQQAAGQVGAPKENGR